MDGDSKEWNVIQSRQKIDIHSLNLFWDDKSIFKDNNNKELSFTNASYETWSYEIKATEVFDDRKIGAEWVCEVDEEEAKWKSWSCFDYF